MKEDQIYPRKSNYELIHRMKVVTVSDEEIKRTINFFTTFRIAVCLIF